MIINDSLIVVRMDTKIDKDDHDWEWPGKKRGEIASDFENLQTHTRFTWLNPSFYCFRIIYCHTGTTVIDVLSGLEKGYL